MSDTSSTTGDYHCEDIAIAFPDPIERNRLIEWGSRYLSSSNEDQSVRVAHLTLELAGLIWKQCRYRSRRISRWQVRLLTLAMVVECTRRKQLTEGAVDRDRLN